MYICGKGFFWERKREDGFCLRTYVERAFGSRGGLVGGIGVLIFKL